MSGQTPENLQYTKNVAVIGSGYWGKNLVRNFYALGGLRVICDTDPTREPWAKAQYPDVAFTSSLDSVLADDQIKAVAVATPAVTHYEVAKVALQAGKDVFVEKPLALQVWQGEELVGLAEKNGRILMVGHILLYHPAVIKCGELISSGELGKIQYLYSNRLNIGKIRTEENILWSFAPHDISVMLALLKEEPSAVSCHGANYLHQSIADVTMSQFVFPSGVQAHIFVSWLHPFKEQRLVVVGSDKMAVFDDTADDKLVLYPHKISWKDRIPVAVKAEAEPMPIEMKEPLQAECEHFLECIRSRKQPRSDGKEGLQVLKILRQCQESMETNRVVTVTKSVTAAEEKPYFAHRTALVDEGCQIGKGTKIWHFSHVMKDAKIGENCILGQNVFVAGGVVVGNNVKVQNNVSIYTGAVIEDDVFLGPSCVLTNVTNPRSQIVRHDLYEKTVIRRGATVGANSTIVCGVELGRYSFVSAGAVVTKNVPDYALVKGVPAKQTGWVSRHGIPLRQPNAEGIMVCHESGYRYKEVEPGVVKCLDLDEDAPLPPDQAVGRVFYRDVAAKKQPS
jgi:UDP-2-acetamido-3-amino-2,3-dideoxy-glucuronate N-acetyltransferase